MSVDLLIVISKEQDTFSCQIKEVGLLNRNRDFWDIPNLIKTYSLLILLSLIFALLFLVNINIKFRSNLLFILWNTW